MTDDTRTLPPYSPWSSDPGYHDQDPWRAPEPSGQPPVPPGSGDSPTVPRPRRPIALVAAVALAAGLVGGGAGAGLTALTDNDGTDSSSSTSTSATSLQDRAAGSDAPAANGSVESVAAKVLPSVVSILVRTPQGSGEGSGIILSSDGLVLTNNHVVAEAASGGDITVTTNDGSTASATIVGRDPITDLAVIKADNVSGWTKATLGRSGDLDPGEQVVAIGSPLGLQGTVTSGIVSALDRPVRTGDASGAESASTVIDAIQTDAAINPGNSGGALVNMRGEVVGINSAIASLGSAAGGQSGSIGLGFAIPIDEARGIARQLIDTGSASHALLGVSVRDSQVTSQATSSSGAVVALVSPGGAADQAGLQQGDVITKVGDRSVDGSDALIAAIRSHRPGDRVAIKYTRGGSEHTVTVRLGSDAQTS